jgi:hypothetical protein
MSQITPEQAREQLDAARTLSCATTREASRNAHVGALTTAGVGCLLAFVLAVSWAFADHDVPAFTLSFVAYAVALVALIRWQRTHQRVFQSGFGRAYATSFAATLVLYGFGVGWLIHHAGWAIMLPYCVLVAVPMLVAARRLMRIARR